MSARPDRFSLAFALAAVAFLLAAVGVAAAKPGGGGGDEGSDRPEGRLKSVVTGRRAELRPTVPIGRRAGQKTKSVLSVKLPDLERGERVRFNG